jgi:hypothetical protein
MILPPLRCLMVIFPSFFELLPLFCEEHLTVSKLVRKDKTALMDLPLLFCFLCDFTPILLFLLQLHF